MQIAARTGAFATNEEQFDVVFGKTFDGKNMTIPADIVNFVTKYIPCIPSHSYTYHTSGVLWGGVIEYDDSFSYIDHWAAKSTFTANSRTRYLRISGSFVNGVISDTTIYDNTDGVYLFKDGKIVNGGGYKLICAPRRYTRFSRPYARFSCHTQELEVAA